MSCRHDLAGGTCLRCYPATGSIDPGPEEDYEPNLEGPGAVTVGGGLLKERQERGVAAKKCEALLMERAARVRRAEEWLRDLAQFFKEGEVRDNMMIILDEVERLRALVRQLGGEP